MLVRRGALMFPHRVALWRLGTYLLPPLRPRLRQQDVSTDLYPFASKANIGSAVTSDGRLTS